VPRSLLAIARPTAHRSRRAHEADDNRSLSSSVPSTRTAAGWLEIARGLSRMRANASAACARPGRSVGQRKAVQLCLHRRLDGARVDDTFLPPCDLTAATTGRVRSGASAGHPRRRR
jgi:hypothetical protein